MLEVEIQNDNLYIIIQIQKMIVMLEVDYNSIFKI